MKYSDISDNVFEISNRCLVMGDSLMVKTSMIKEFLSTCNKTKKVFCIGFQGDNETFVKHVCGECDAKAIIHRIDKRALNSFELFEDWYYLIEHYFSDTRAEETKAYLRFIFELLKYMPEDTSFLNLCERMETVQDALKVLSELNKQRQITMEQYEKYKIMYLEGMAASSCLEDVINEIDAILLDRVSVKAQRILYWCMVRKAIRSLDDAIPVIINHIAGDNLDIVYDLLIEINSKKILFVSSDIFRNISGKEFLTCFELSIFSRISYLPSAKIVEELFGDIKKSRTIYSEAYDCRIGKERWIDKLLKTNKTKTYSTNYEYEAMYRKEEISNFEEGLALFICFAERGYVRCNTC